MTGQLAARQREREAVVLYDVVGLLGETELEDALGAVAERLRTELQLVAAVVELWRPGGEIVRISPGGLSDPRLQQDRSAAAHVLQGGHAPAQDMHAAPGSELGLEVSREPDAVRVEVLDRGPGVPAAALPHLFDPFYRAIDGQSPKGLGLGLAVVKGLVEAHGGRVFAENRPNGGACFGFTLPLARVPASALA